MINVILHAYICVIVLIIVCLFMFMMYASIWFIVNKEFEFEFEFITPNEEIFLFQVKMNTGSAAAKN